jgi:hypothetical protein
MKNRPEIALNFDMADFSLMQGKVNDILSGREDEYVTRIVMVLPLAPFEIHPGEYRIEYQARTVDIRLQIISDTQNDPIMRLGRNSHFGNPGTGVPTLPFWVFTDNRGKYPCVLGTIVFPYRLANWADLDSQTGIRIDQDSEEIQVTGPSDLRDKIVSLTVLNRLLKTRALKGDFRPITYDQVTVFREEYFRSPSTVPVLKRLTSLASKTAYRDAIQEYFLSGFDKQQLEDSAKELAHTVSGTPINSESDLLKVVASALSNVLAHHIENRRWIDAFWDGERKITHGTEEIIVPRQPKKETEIQPTLHVVLDMALSPLGIQVVRESDEGVGTLDFRFLYTTKSGLGISVGTEFKLAHHKEIRKGIRNQLPAYLRAIKSTSGIFSMMWFKDQDGRFFGEPRAHQKQTTIQWLKSEAKDISGKDNITILAFLIDASIKPSASKITETSNDPVRPIADKPGSI